MKANHNDGVTKENVWHVVVNISKSKNESKSQLLVAPPARNAGCGQYQ